MNIHQAKLLSFLSKAANEGVEMPSQLLDEFSTLARKALEKHFSDKDEEEFRLRMSNVGKPLCQLQMQAKNTEEEPKDYSFKMRMIIGDILEAVLITLIKASGIEVKNIHKKVELKNKDIDIKGEFDIELSDGIYDIKTVSPYAFDHKFNSDNAFENIKSSDTFGYVTQGYAYGEAAKLPFKGWIAINKSTGQINFAEAPDDDKEKKEVLNALKKTHRSIHNGKPFKRCFSDVKETYYSKPTGNRVLGFECSYCPFKFSCWKDLEFKRQLSSKGRNPKWVWYTHISNEWRNSAD